MASVKTVAASFGQLDTIPFSSARKLIQLLESADDVSLQLIVRHRVKFCWPIARRILRDRGFPVHPFHLTISESML